MGDVLNHRTRSAFKKEFGRAVQKNPSIQDMLPSDPTLIPNHKFVTTIENMLTIFCDTDALLESLPIHIHQSIINPASQEQSHGAANDNASAKNQKIYEITHDGLIHEMDKKLSTLAYLIKVSEFLPTVSHKFNGAFCHLSEGEGIRKQIMTLYFDDLSNKDFLLQHINKTIDDVLPDIYRLRYLEDILLTDS